MKRNTRLLLLSIGGALSLGVIGAVAIGSEAASMNLAGTAKTYNHYTATQPTATNNGNREYWVCCEDHSHVFAEPTGTGVTITEGGALPAEALAGLADTDDRYIPSLNVIDAKLAALPAGQNGYDNVAISRVETTLGYLTEASKGALTNLDNLALAKASYDVSYVQLFENEVSRYSFNSNSGADTDIVDNAQFGKVVRFDNLSKGGWIFNYSIAGESVSVADYDSVVSYVYNPTEVQQTYYLTNSDWSGGAVTQTLNKGWNKVVVPTSGHFKNNNYNGALIGISSNAAAEGTSGWLFSAPYGVKANHARDIKTGLTITGWGPAVTEKLVPTEKGPAVDYTFTEVGGAFEIQLPTAAAVTDADYVKFSVYSPKVAKFTVSKQDWWRGAYDFAAKEWKTSGDTVTFALKSGWNDFQMSVADYNEINYLSVYVGAFAVGDSIKVTNFYSDKYETAHVKELIASLDGAAITKFGTFAKLDAIATELAALSSEAVATIDNIEIYNTAKASYEAAYSVIYNPRTDATPVGGCASGGTVAFETGTDATYGPVLKIKATQTSGLFQSWIYGWPAKAYGESNVLDFYVKTPFEAKANTSQTLWAGTYATAKKTALTANAFTNIHGTGTELNTDGAFATTMSPASGSFINLQRYANGDALPDPYSGDYLMTAVIATL